MTTNNTNAYEGSISQSFMTEEFMGDGPEMTLEEAEALITPEMQEWLNTL